VMGGDDDPIIPVLNPRMQARLIPSSQLVIYHGGHLAILTEAPQLAPVIEHFLTEQSADEGHTDD
jgi:pimeloyl-ACP methyl ester carboxylesterase